MTEEAPPEWTKGPVRSPVDISDDFHASGMTLITDPRSDVFLRQYRESSKLATPQQEGAEEDSQTSSSAPSEGKT